MASLSDPRVRAFLGQGTRTGKLGYLGSGGRPLVAPVWFVVEDGAIVFNTGKHTAKGRALARDPRATMCVDLEEPPYAFVQVQGEAELSEDPAELIRTATVIAARYMGAARAEEFGKRNGVPGELVVRLRPVKVIASFEVTGLPVRDLGGTAQRAPVLVLPRHHALGLAEDLLGDPGDRPVAAHQRFVVRAAADLLAQEHPRPDLLPLLVLEVAVVIEPPRDPDPERPVPPPGLDGEGVRRQTRQPDGGQVVGAETLRVGLWPSRPADIQPRTALAQLGQLVQRPDSDHRGRSTRPPGDNTLSLS
jgi:PPOX class probable F420-dependent enzyme